MKRIAIALLLVLVAATAQAATVMEIQTGLVTVGDPVEVYNLTVTAVRYNGVFAAEAPYGPNNHIWIYTGGAPTAVEGDIVDVAGLYIEHFELSEIDASAGLVAVTGAGAVPAPIVVPAALLVADSEPYESCLITVPDMMVVTNLLGYGEWDATVSGDGSVVVFDDYWYDASTVMVGDCYSSVTGVMLFSYGIFKLELLENGTTFCAVDTEETNFGSVKSLFR